MIIRVLKPGPIAEVPIRQWRKTKTYKETREENCYLNHGNLAKLKRKMFITVIEQKSHSKSLLGGGLNIKIYKETNFLS